MRGVVTNRKLETITGTRRWWTAAHSHRCAVRRRCA